MNVNFELTLTRDARHWVRGYCSGCGVQIDHVRGHGDSPKLNAVRISLAKQLAKRHFSVVEISEAINHSEEWVTQAINRTLPKETRKIAGETYEVVAECHAKPGNIIREEPKRNGTTRVLILRKDTSPQNL